MLAHSASAEQHNGLYVSGNTSQTQSPHASHRHQPYSQGSIPASSLAGLSPLSPASEDLGEQSDESTVFSDDDPDAENASSAGPRLPSLDPEEGLRKLLTSRHGGGRSWDRDAAPRRTLLSWVSEPTDPQTRLARRIVAISRMGLIACPSSAHYRQQDLSDDESPGQDAALTPDLTGVAAATRNRHPVSVTSLSEVGHTLDRLARKHPHWHTFLGLNRRAALYAENTPQASRKMFPNAKYFASAIEGTFLPDQARPNICLAEDHCRSVPILHPFFDVDSYIYTFTSLTSVRTALSWMPTPQPTRRIHNNIHLSQAIRFKDADDCWVEDTVPLHQIPHLLPGTLIGRFDLFLFLPRFYNPDQSTGIFPISNDDYALLFEDIIYPAIVRDGGQSITPHLPTTFNLAQQRDRLSKGSKGGRGSSMSYEIHSGFFPSIDDTMQQKFQQDRSPLLYWRFGDYFFGIDTKNTKTRYGGSKSVQDSLERVQQEIDSIVHTTRGEVSTEVEPNRDAALTGYVAAVRPIQYTFSLMKTQW
ncbi:hypothetical protein LY78DRAFT_687177 [Colletotrichum sublineola]|nr:hypothetical protein LY78DRAFT_687177 [Colletotrichum sublineola]